MTNTETRIKDLEESLHGAAIQLDRARDTLIKVEGMCDVLISAATDENSVFAAGNIAQDCFQMKREIEGPRNVG